MSKFGGLQALDSWFYFLRHNQFLDVMVKKVIMASEIDYDAETRAKNRGPKAH